MKWTFAASFLLRRWSQRREGAKKIVLAAGVAAITAVDLSHAATITVKTSDNGSSIVYVTGRFQPDDDTRFESATASLSRVFVTFDSPGGSAVAGMSFTIRGSRLTSAQVRSAHPHAA